MRDTFPIPSLPWATGDDVLIRAYLELLGIESTDYAAASVLSLLRIPGIRSAFGLEESALDSLVEKLTDAGVCRHLDVPPGRDRYGSWCYVLDRLLLGFIGGAQIGFI